MSTRKLFLEKRKFLGKTSYSWALVEKDRVIGSSLFDIKGEMINHCVVTNGQSLLTVATVVEADSVETLNALFREYGVIFGQKDVAGV